MEKKIKTKNLKTKTPYSHYQNTEEWAIIASLLEELENNQDIELKTAPEYVIGYLVAKLRNKDLLAEQEKVTVKRVNGRNGLRLSVRAARSH